MGVGRRVGSRVGVVGVVAVVAAVGAVAASCAHDVGTLGGTVSAATAISPGSGQLVGTSTDAAGVLHAFVRRPGSTQLEVLGVGTPTGVRDDGLVVGERVLADGHKAAVRWEGTNQIDVPRLPTNDWERMTAVNQSGVIVGAGGELDLPGVGIWNWPIRAIVWAADGSRRTIDGLPGYHANTVALDINEHNQIVGQAGNDISGFGAFLWDGTTRELAKPVGRERSTAIATAINDTGDVVGYGGGPIWWDTATRQPHAFPDLHGARISVLVDVNDDGIAIGSGHPAGDPSTSSVEEHAFCVNLRTGVVDELGPESVAAAIDDHGVIAGSLRGRATTWTDLRCLETA